MGNGLNLFDGYVMRSILANNQFGITEVKNIESLKSISFIKEEYAVIENLIKNGDIEAIKTFSENQPRSGEYLMVMRFNDQTNKKYIVTVYDSDMLEQDPQVIEIYLLE